MHWQVYTVPLTEMQQAYLDNCNRRWSVKSGATGSGKTYVDTLVTIPKRILACRGEGLIVLMGNTRGTLERNILEPMRGVYGGMVGNIRADNTAYLFGKKCYALGADNKKRVEKIQGATFEYAYGDEVTTWDEGVFQMLKSRLRCEHSHFDGTCNPERPTHWFKKFLDSDADIYQQAYKIEDNKYLPAEFVEQLKKEYAGTVYYDRYIKGLWVAAEGAIYRVFADHPQTFYYTPEVAQKVVPTYFIIGVDFGGDKSAHAFTLTGFTRGFGAMVTLEEYYRHEVISPLQLENDFIEFCKMCLQKYSVHDAYCDSAETTLIRGFENAVARNRLPIMIHGALKVGVNDRIRCMCRLQSGGRYFISPNCVHTIDALTSAVWDSKDKTEDVRLDDGTTNIDSLDAMEYTYERNIRELMNARWQYV